MTSEKSLPLSEPQFPQLQMETMKPLLLTLLGGGAGKPHTARVTRSRGSVTTRWLHPAWDQPGLPSPEDTGVQLAARPCVATPDLAKRW